MRAYKTERAGPIPKARSRSVSLSMRGNKELGTGPELVLARLLRKKLSSQQTPWKSGLRLRPCKAGNLRPRLLVARLQRTLQASQESRRVLEPEARQKPRKRQACQAGTGVDGVESPRGLGARSQEKPCPSRAESQSYGVATIPAEGPKRFTVLGPQCEAGMSLIDEPWKHDEKFLMQKARLLVGKGLFEIAESIKSIDDESRVTTKGGAAYALEEYFGVGRDGRGEPDFPDLHIELKSVPLKEKNGMLTVKEPMSLNMMNYGEGGR